MTCTQVAAGREVLVGNEDLQKSAHDGHKEKACQLTGNRALLPA